MLVKRNTVKKPQANKPSKVKLKHVKSDLTKDSKLVHVISPGLLVKRDPGRPRGSKSKMAMSEMQLGLRLTRSAANLAIKDKT